jgi:hypothetical protein
MISSAHGWCLLLVATAISTCRLYSGSADGALSAAMMATEICEGEMDPEYELMHNCYSMQVLFTTLIHVLFMW